MKEQDNQMKSQQEQLTLINNENQRIKADCSMFKKDAAQKQDEIEALAKENYELETQLSQLKENNETLRA